MTPSNLRPALIAGISLFALTSATLSAPAWAAEAPAAADTTGSTVGSYNGPVFALAGVFLGGASSTPFTIGDGGNREGLATKWLAETPVSAYRMATYGHGELTVVNATHAFWAWHQNPDLEPTIADSLWIVKGQDC